MERFGLGRIAHAGHSIAQWAEDATRDIGRGDLDTALERLRRIGDEAGAIRTNAVVVQEKLRELAE
jgi:hypothetical protein